MNEPKLSVYYDKESDYLEIRFGNPTESNYEKIGSDTYARIDESTGEIKGYAIFNVQKTTGNINVFDFKIPNNILNFGASVVQ